MHPIIQCIFMGLLALMVIALGDIASSLERIDYFYIEGKHGHK